MQHNSTINNAIKYEEMIVPFPKVKVFTFGLAMTKFLDNESLSKTMNYVLDLLHCKCMSNRLISFGFIIYSVVQYSTRKFKKCVSFKVKEYFVTSLGERSC